MAAPSPAVALPPTAVAPRPSPTAPFAPVDCAAFGAASDVATEDAVCGDVTVPLRHAEPRGQTITLAVAVVKRAGPANDGPSAEATTPDGGAADTAPLILLQGGPGGSTIDAFLGLALVADTDPFGLAAIRRQRDIVLLDQRGTRYGRPALMCPELTDLTRKTIELDLDTDVYFALEDDAIADCRDRLYVEGIDAAAFNSLESAADIGAVAAVLGYDRYHVYGVSYGSLLALHLARMRPAGLLSIVLDGVVPPPIDFNVEAPASLDSSLSALFDACDAAPDCRTAYPHLEADLVAALDRLDDRPARIPVTDPASGIRYRAIVDGRSLLDAVHQLMYGGPAVPIVPYLIDAAADGRYGALGELMGTWVFDDTLAEGLYLSTVCSEDGDIDPEAVTMAGVRPWLADRLAGDVDDILAGCELWDVPALDAAVDAPVASDIPALLMSGRFDPITPPPFAAAAARTLTRAQRVIFPAGGHGALGEPCANTLVAAFLARPTAPLDTACAATPAAPDFRTPADTAFSTVPSAWLARIGNLIDGASAERGGDETDRVGESGTDASRADASGTEADGLGKADASGADPDASPDLPDAAQRTLDGSDPHTAPGLAATLAPFALLAAAWLALFSAVALWTVGRAFGAAGDPRWPARLLPWLSAAALSAPAIFGIGLLILVWWLVDAGQEMVLYVGVPRGWAWLLWLPGVAGLCGAGLAAVAVWAWPARAWTVARRLHAAVIGAAGLAVGLAMAWLGAL